MLENQAFTSGFYIVLELLIAVFSVLGNVLVCWAVCINSNLQTITNFFVVSLAVADIAVGVLAIPFAIAISTGFCSNFYGCLFIACFVLVLTQNSIFSLLAIAVDRYIAIKIPLRYNSLVTTQRARGVIAICWIFSIIIGLTPFVGWYKPSMNVTVNVTVNVTKSCPPGLMRCLFEEVVAMEYMVYFNFFACVLIPLLLMLAIYVCIFMAARHQLRLMETKVVHGEKSRSTLQKEVQAAKSLAIIVGLFAVCWLPLHIINCFTLFCRKCDHCPLWVLNIAIILSHANSVINPFIYAYRIREFRQTFRKITRQHILGKQDVLESSSFKFNSTANSVADSIRLKANGLCLELLTEQSRGDSSCESSHHCADHLSTAGGSLVAVSHPPMSAVITHCPKVGPCPLQALRQSEIPMGHHVQQDLAGLDVPKDKSKQEQSSAQVALLLNMQNRRSCFSELNTAS
ncbi:adenosine A2a receptor a isoform 1-T2 [Pholidichthys leucotaenia]